MCRNCCRLVYHVTAVPVPVTRGPEVLHVYGIRRTRTRVCAVPVLLVLSCTSLRKQLCIISLSQRTYIPMDVSDHYEPIGRRHHRFVRSQLHPSV